MTAIASAAGIGRVAAVGLPSLLGAVGAVVMALLLARQRRAAAA